MATSQCLNEEKSLCANTTLPSCGTDETMLRYTSHLSYCHVSTLKSEKKNFFCVFRNFCHAVCSLPDVLEDIKQATLDTFICTAGKTKQVMVVDSVD